MHTPPRNMPRANGFCMGLAIVQRLASLLGHKVEVRSLPGKASIFTVVGPLVREQFFPSQHQGLWVGPALGVNNG